jgi:hypothetical protein
LSSFVVVASDGAIQRHRTGVELELLRETHTPLMRPQMIRKAEMKPPPRRACERPCVRPAASGSLTVSTPNAMSHTACDHQRIEQRERHEVRVDVKPLDPGVHSSSIRSTSDGGSVPKAAAAAAETHHAQDSITCAVAYSSPRSCWLRSSSVVAAALHLLGRDASAGTG